MWRHMAGVVSTFLMQCTGASARKRNFLFPFRVAGLNFRALLLPITIPIPRKTDKRCERTVREFDTIAISTETSFDSHVRRLPL
jgi:hypothetical protein